MFDVGWSELLVIAVVALVVIGPKELPTTLRTIGKMTSRARKVAGEFRAQFDEAMREAELDDVRQTISDAQKLNPVNSLREAMNPLRQMGNEIKADLQRSTPAAATSTPGEPVSEPSMGLPEMPPIIPAASEAAPVASPASVTPPQPVVVAEQAPAKPKTVRKPRAKAPGKTDEVAAAVVDTSVVAEKPKRAPRKVVAAATVDAPAAAAVAPRKRPTASKTTPKKKDQA
ncbi:MULTISPECIES: Sec-independent protein translocase protein TatB [Rhizobium]|uniref:Sec-independent protein translocase protein TatB n=1 Tax=Rhizobium paranaense TaxID=1650438 RepID=A0A7W8XMY9_9HYPH|nr:MULTISPECIES: Sec-independent protein translocase protein TatB [Rhizobium]MBB5572383.1 sec-independent protein translocase protein TatB [Rhizobium paranaense]PST63437.1 twin-arginine translocase subunit TatB [Rhizobium sp. SEMIA4064]